jgi:hypothetical protein
MPLVLNKPPRILNPIPQINIEKFKTIFFEENALQINELTNTLNNEQLTEEQWHTSCTKLNYLIQKKFDNIQDTSYMQCTTSPSSHKPYITTRRLLTKKTSKKMEKIPLHLPPNQKSNLPHKKFTKLVNTSNNRRVKKPHPN